MRNKLIYRNYKSFFKLAFSLVQVYWSHRNREVVEDSRHRLLHEGNFFCVDISPLMVEDEGPWRCVAENNRGQASCSAGLRVIGKKDIYFDL